MSCTCEQQAKVAGLAARPGGPVLGHGRKARRLRENHLAEYFAALDRLSPRAAFKRQHSSSPAEAPCLINTTGRLRFSSEAVGAMILSPKPRYNAGLLGIENRRSPAYQDVPPPHALSVGHVSPPVKLMTISTLPRRSGAAACRISNCPLEVGVLIVDRVISTEILQALALVRVARARDDFRAEHLASSMQPCRRHAACAEHEHFVPV